MTGVPPQFRDADLSKFGFDSYSRDMRNLRKIAEARQTAVNDAVAYLQGNLSECAEVLMDIVRDKETQPQVRINAINSVFAGVKGLSTDNREVLAGMAVKIIDSI